VSFRLRTATTAVWDETHKWQLHERVAREAGLPGRPARLRARRQDSRRFGKGRHRLGNRVVTVPRGVLVQHCRARAGVASSVHELGDGSALGCRPREAGVAQVVLSRHRLNHDLRHSCASLLLAADVPVKVVQELLEDAAQKHNAVILVVLSCSTSLPPPGHPTLQVYVDESGIANQSPYLAVGALVFRRDHGLVTNEVLAFRDKSGWRKEGHFVDVARDTAYLYREVVNIVAQSDGRFVCLVIDKSVWDPFGAQREAWKTHAQLTIQLLNAVIGKGHPILSVAVDHITTPAAVNYEGYIATAVNRTQNYLAVAGVNRLDSRSCVGLQQADILTGAVAHQYRQKCDASAKAGSPKGLVAAHVAQTWNLTTLVRAASPRFKVVEVRLPKPKRTASCAFAVQDDRNGIKPALAKLKPVG
jgi:hypothetical protein